MAWAWYGVKTLYRIQVRGRPRGRDGDYDPKGTLVEERVVVVRARSHGEAIRKGEADARDYATGSHTNPYGQAVRIRRLKTTESFELFDPPSNMAEVWSSTRVVPATIRDAAIIDCAFGPEESKDALRKRKKYLNREFSRRGARPDV